MKITKSLFLLVFGLGTVFCLNAQQRLAAQNNPNAVAGAGQAEIIINAENADRDIVVWINGTIVAHIPPKSREKIIVNNGNYQVEIADSSLKGNNWNIGSKKSISVASNSNSTTLGFTVRYGAIVNISIQGISGTGAVVASAPVPTPAPAPAAKAPAPAPPAPSPPTPSPPKPAPPEPAIKQPKKPLIPLPGKGISGIESALIRAANIIIESMKQGTTVAVLSISSKDSSESEFVIDELTFHLVSTSRFKVVDRRSLDAIQAEAKFQYSGDVDDNSAVSIGKLLGANIVITGSVSGSGSTRRLRLKALNVQTAEIMAMASEAF